MTKVSVIIPVYNTEKYLAECLTSVINQTLKDIEIICINAGSTDNSLNILNEFATKDNRIKILNEQHMFAGVARNMGLKIATGKYLSFLDSDDWFDRNMLETMYNKAEEDSSDIVICEFASFDTRINKIAKMFYIPKDIVEISPFNPKEISEKLFDFSKPNAWTKLFKKQFFIDNNLFFENCICCNDLTCVCTAMTLANKISIVDKIFVYYRIHQKTSITSSRNENIDSVLYALQKLQDNLKEKNLYDIYINTYKNKAIISFLWNKNIYNNKAKIKTLREKLSSCFLNKIISKDLYNYLLFKLLKKEPTMPNITSSSLNYKTYQDLLLDIKKNLFKIPLNIDLIVGIPRSGMIPAYMLGLALSKQVCSLREFISEDYKSLNTHRINLNNSININNILIVDDSINSGKTFLEVKEQLSLLNLDKKYNIKYLAIYYRENNYNEYIDFALEKVLSPRLFQWNYLNHTFLQKAAFDLDGVLCYDPTDEENDDNEKYMQFILNAKPLFIPQYRIPYIITSRLSKYKKETEEWLKKNNVQYDNLIMLSGYTASQRKNLGLHSRFKASIYHRLKDIPLFIESNRNQAMEIAKLSGKLCFCSTTDELFGRK